MSAGPASITAVPRQLKFASLTLIALATLGLWLLLKPARPLSPPQASAGLSSPQLEAIAPNRIQAALAKPGPRLNRVSAAVLPHHLPADRLIGRLVARLDPTRIKTVVLIGPDHQNKGASRFSLSRSNWAWAGQTIKTNTAVVEQLSRRPEFSVAEPVIQAEHSVLIPLPFLAEQLPEANFVLIAVKGGWDRPAAEQLAVRLAQILAPDDLVVASVDFSHQSDLSDIAADDERSAAALQAGTVEAVSGAAADSPMSLAVAAAYARLRQATHVTVLEHSNSAAELNRGTNEGITSYFTAVWQAAE